MRISHNDNTTISWFQKKGNPRGYMGDPQGQNEGQPLWESMEPHNGNITITQTRGMVKNKPRTA